MKNNKRENNNFWGKKHSEETRRKMREAWKQRVYEKEMNYFFNKHLRPWNKGVKGLMPIPWNKGKKYSPEIRNKISQALKGRKVWNKGLKGVQRHTKESKQKLRDKMVGRVLTPEWKRKIGEANKKSLLGVMVGEKNPAWKGGVAVKNRGIRASREYEVWRRAVFERDDYICQDCFQRGGLLEAHHIRSFALFPDLRLDISNGITLCRKCHNKYPKRPLRVEINEAHKKEIQ